MNNKIDIFIEIGNSNIIISKLINSKFKFYLCNYKKIKLKELTVKNNKIFNMSLIYSLIKEYLIQNNIKKKEVLVNLSKDLDCKENHLQKDFLIFQLALLIGKTNLKIKKITNYRILEKGDNKMPYKLFIAKNKLEKKLDFFEKFNNKKQTNPRKWLFSTAFLAICYMLLFFNIRQNKKNKLIKLREQNGKLTESLKNIKINLKALNSLKAKNLNLENKINKIEAYKNKINNPIKIIENLGKNIPKGCKLTQMNISGSKDNKNSRAKIMELHGLSISQEKIIKFANKLEKNDFFLNSKIDYIQKVKNYKNSNNYIFKTSCNIKNIE